MIIFFVFTIIAIGKRSRVFSSFFQFLGSALKIQLQNYKKKRQLWGRYWIHAGP